MKSNDISPEAVEHIRSEMAADPDSRLFEVSRNRLEALLAALTQSSAETAAAYERAAKLFDRNYEPPCDCTRCDCGNVDDAREMIECRADISAATAIRALATPDQADARDRMIADAEARGMHRAAAIAYQFEGNDKLRCAILSAIPKGGDA